MFDNTYKSMNNQIYPDVALVEDTIEISKHYIKQTERRHRQYFRRPLAIAAVLFLVVVLTTPVLAASVPAIYDLMYLVSPEIAQFFVPVQEFCEDNGIRMEVVSVNINNEKAEIYVTMQDLTDNRVDETTDLFDSYSINRNFDCTATCKRIGYDPETRTATFMIQISEWGNHDIIGSKLTFSVREFLSHKTKLENYPMDINFAEVSEALETQEVTLTGISGSNSSEENELRSYEVLLPTVSVYIPIEDFSLTAIGYVDGKLHIQLKTINKLTTDAHGFFFLTDEDGELVESYLSVAFAEGVNSNKRVDYQEFIFAVPQEEIENYKLYGSFYTSGMITKGNWQVTFPLTLSRDK